MREPRVDTQNKARSALCLRARRTGVTRPGADAAKYFPTVMTSLPARLFSNSAGGIHVTRGGSRDCSHTQHAPRTQRINRAAASARTNLRADLPGAPLERRGRRLRGERVHVRARHGRGAPRHDRPQVHVRGEAELARERGEHPQLPLRARVHAHVQQSIKPARAVSVTYRWWVRGIQIQIQIQIQNILVTQVKPATSC